MYLIIITHENGSTCFKKKFKFKIIKRTNAVLSREASVSLTFALDSGNGFISFSVVSKTVYLKQSSKGLGLSLKL